MHEFEHQCIDGRENLFEAQLFGHQPADFLEEAQLLLGPFQLRFELFYLGHCFIIAGRFG